MLEAVGRVLRHLDAGLPRAGERDHGHVGMGDDRVADLSPAPVDDVDDAAGDAGLDQQLDEALAESGRVGGRLEDDGVPADERGQDLPRRDRDREVPRRDHADDADRLPDAHVELVRKLGRCRLPEQAPALAAHVVGHVDRFLDVAARLGQDLAHLAGHQLRDVFLLLGQQLGEAEEDLAPPRSWDEPPVLVGRLRGGDCAVDVLGARARESADRLAVRGARAFEGLAGGGVDPLAADVVLEGLRAQDRHGVDSSRPLRARLRPRGRCRGCAAAAVAGLALAAGLAGRVFRRSGPSRRSTMTVTFGLSL